MNWNARRNQISDSVWHYVYTDPSNQPLTFRQVVELWAGDSALFRGFHNQVLQAIPFRAMRWETPVVDLNRFDREFEFVVIDSPSLDRSENPSAFEEQFALADQNETVIQFENLGKDATLVVPMPSGATTSGSTTLDSKVNHCHLASFLATCGAAEESALWQATGIAMLSRVSDKPVWLSTAGGGVAWLHIRLDDRPKYYGYRPYRES